MIKVENATFSYNKSDNIFKNLNFSVEKGETLAILGANGIGKTTLLKCIMRFLKLSSGEIFVDGKNAKTMTDLEFWRYISYVPQARSFIFNYTVLDMVVMGRTPYIKFGRTPKIEDYELSLNILKDFGIESLAHRLCNQLSGGQLQLALIARALVKEPKVLIMDEPESNLDMKNQIKVLDLIQSLSKKRDLSIIINTHFPAHAIRIAHKTLMLGSHEYIFDQTLKVIDKDNIEKFFEVVTKIVTVDECDNQFQGIIPITISEVAYG